MTLTHNKCTSCFSPHASRVRRSCQCQILLQTQLSQKQIFAISLSVRNNKNDLCYEISPSWPAIPSTKWIIYINLSNCRYLSGRATLSQNCRLLEIFLNIIKFQSFYPIFVYLRVERNLTFLNNKFGKGQYAFYPVKSSRFAEKNKGCRKYQNFIRGDSFELGRRPLQPMKNEKVNHCLDRSIDTLK